MARTLKLSTFGARVRFVREELGWSQVTLAARASTKERTISNVTVSRWEDRTDAPEGDACEVLGAATKTRPEWLRNGVGARRA